MSWLDGLRHRLRTVVRPRDFERELEEEMRFHLELDAMQQGDATRARRRFGSRAYHKEETRRMTWLAPFDVLRQDVRYGWRSLARSPGLTALIVVTLALGIGVNATTFSVLDRLYVRPPAGVTEPGGVRRVWVEHFNWNDGPQAVSGMNYPTFAALSAVAPDSVEVALYLTDYSRRLGRRPGTSKVRGVYATASYFQVLGVRPALGRVFAADEDELGKGAMVAVVSHRFWRTHLGGDTAALGRPIDIDKQRYILIGVLDPSFTGLDLQAEDVWVPLGSWEGYAWMKGPWWEYPWTFAPKMLVRVPRGGLALAEEVAFLHRASLAVREVNRKYSPREPDTLATVHLGSILEAVGPGKPGQELIISTRLGGVALIVLLIACANVMNLLLARAVRRRREIAVRLALGISRTRLVRLLTTETVLLGLLAGSAALLLASWGGSLLRTLLFPEIEWAGGAIDARVTIFTMLVAVIAGTVAGVVPALQGSNPDLTSALKSGSRDGGSHRSLLRRGLVVTQAALSVMLLVGAALFVRSLRNVQAIDIGYDASRLLFGRVAFADDEAPPDAVVAARMEEIAERLKRRPGIDAVARAVLEPMRGFSFVTFYFGADSSERLRQEMPTMMVVSPSFFRTVGLGFLRGHNFGGPDGTGPAREVIVNDAMARLLWPGADPLGECIRFMSRDSSCHTVIGVVENSRRNKVLEAEPAPQYYLTLGDLGLSRNEGTILIVRATAGATSVAAAEIASSLRRAFPAAEATVNPMTKNLEPEYRPWRLGATLFTAFGLLALVVAVIGIYSTVWYGVNQRTHEFGVRVALGAQVADVVRQVLGENLRVVAIGVVIGIGLALAAGRLIASLLYGVEPSDARVMALVAVALVAVGTVAALQPAWRASRVDPAAALRSE